MKTALSFIAATSMTVAVGLTGQISLAGGHITSATAALQNLEGAEIGMAEITQTPHGVLVHVRVTDLPPGAKGIHFHRTAQCAADDGFTSSHGHHGEGEGEHGLLNAAGPGQGDLGNIFVGSDGVGEMQFFKDGVFLDGGDEPLLDGDGTAIVIHAEMDDQVSQPIGGAGARIVCGIVQAS
ncbi:superoxide dismutase family protein [Pseudooctadecabacter jejudonensis]|uniref:Superoxide dismutase [Cu-Zn] n=1 Tax=Pseudooctadecabacter jejudonensis TaxID=1391910 RepID=A0A1Y5RCB8_9RHOB|nr:superoxide dismutase family protein [Pseudooctadecabacter jejudonensis]SLN13308.1 Superoxide dismutase [Cu-Zn] precursor [Pseudooctadecabacter jejudonensis]